MSDQDSGRKRLWVAQVLGITIPAPPGVAADPAQLMARMKAVGEKIKAAGASHDLVDDLKAAGAALHGHDLGVAAALLDEIEARLDSRAHAADAAAEIRQAAPSNKVGTVDFAKIRLKWSATRSARQSAVDAMRTVCAKMLEDPDVIADPEFEELQDASARVHELMPDLPDEIDDLLDAMATTDAAKRAAARAEALAAIKSYRGTLDTVEGLRLLQDLPVGNFAIYDSVVSALTNLETALAA